MRDNPFAGMKVYIEKDLHDKFKSLVERKSGNINSYPFTTMKDLFIVAACAGAKVNKYKKLKSQKDIFYGETFDKDIDVPLLFVLAYKNSGDLDTLLDPKNVLELAQGWVSGGIEIIEQNILDVPGLPLNNFVNWLLES